MTLIKNLDPLVPPSLWSWQKVADSHKIIILKTVVDMHVGHFRKPSFTTCSDIRPPRSFTKLALSQLWLRIHSWNKVR